MYNKILVPLDGSKRAESILPHVEELAHRYNAEVIFLQVLVPTVIATETAMAYEQELIAEQTKQAESYMAGLEGTFRKKNIVARSLVTVGPIVQMILEVAKRENVDLIAMASHGRSGLARVFYGSVAAGILHGVDRPLLLVRATNGEK